MSGRVGRRRSRGGGPKWRPPTAAQKEEWRDLIREALGDLPIQEKDLGHAIGQFRPDFNLAAWKRAFDSVDPVERAKANSLKWPFATIVNHLNATMLNGTVVAGLMAPPQRKFAAPLHYQVLEKTGIIGAGERRDIERVNEVRARLTHFYAQATAEEVHEAVQLLQRLLTGKFRQKLSAWLQSDVL